MPSSGLHTEPDLALSPLLFPFFLFLETVSFPQNLSVASVGAPIVRRLPKISRDSVVYGGLLVAQNLGQRPQAILSRTLRAWCHICSYPVYPFVSLLLKRRIGLSPEVLARV